MAKKLKIIHHETFAASLQKIIDWTRQHETIRIDKIFSFLLGKGYAALLILFSLPFCLPVTIPGFSTPFGLLLAFIGIRIAFARHLWWPEWILKKEIPSQKLEKVAIKALEIIEKMHKILRPRWVFLIQNPVFHRLHGVYVFLLGMFLALPLPIPFTNMLAAFPLLCIGLGMLEDDGLFITIGYLVGWVGFGALAVLLIIGKNQFFGG